MNQDRTFIFHLQKTLKNGEDFILATVIKTWGSAPNPVGSMLIVNALGEIFGSVSGGCVEGALIIEAITTLKSNKCKVLTFGVTNEKAFQVGLACGGEIQVLLEPFLKTDKISRDNLANFIQGHLNETLSIYTIDLMSFKRTFHKDNSKLALKIPVEKFDEGCSFILGNTFYSILFPRPKLVIVGAVHIAQYLANFAQMFEYQIHVIDPRSTFASIKRFPKVKISVEWPDTVLNEASLDKNCALITLTHDPKIDDMALQKALDSDCFYIGSLGSTRTHEQRINRFKLLGFKEEKIHRIKGPVGLDIGAKSPNEIALSIMAEIISVRRKR